MFWTKDILAIVLLHLSAGAHLVAAQSQTFRWSMKSANEVSNPGYTLTQCNSATIVVNDTQISNNPLSVPPYYMMSYEIGGTTSVSQIGSNASNLSWTVNHAAGSNLVLQVIDSAGNSGGTASGTFDVVEGSFGNACLPTPNTDFLSISTNTTTLTTCEPLILDIYGGGPPYTVSIIPLNYTTVFNATLSADENQYLWVNRAEPGGSLIAVVSDSYRQYAKATQLIQLQGGTNFTCDNLQSQGSQQTVARAETHLTAFNKLWIADGVFVIAIIAYIGYIIVRG